MPRRIREHRLTTKDSIRAKPFRILEEADRANTDAARGPGAYDRWQKLHRLVTNWIRCEEPLADDPLTLLLLVSRERRKTIPPTGRAERNPSVPKPFGLPFDERDSPTPIAKDGPREHPLLVAADPALHQAIAEGRVSMTEQDLEVWGPFIAAYRAFSDAVVHAKTASMNPAEREASLRPLYSALERARSEAIPRAVFGITEGQLAAVRLPFTNGMQALIEAIGRTWDPTREPWLNVELKRWGREQNPRLTSLRAKHELIRLSLVHFQRTRPDRDPQFVKMGADWIVDRHGRKRLVMPDPAECLAAGVEPDLNTGEYVEWFCRSVQRIVRDDILQVPKRMRSKAVALRCPVCEKGQIVKGRCDRCRVAIGAAFGDERLTARPTGRTRRMNRGHQIDELGSHPDKPLIANRESPHDDDEDAADRWLRSHAATSRAATDAAATISDTTLTRVSRELRAHTLLARRLGVTFRGLQADILKLAEHAPDLTDREIALGLSTTEGSVKDARRKIRRKLAKS